MNAIFTAASAAVIFLSLVGSGQAQAQQPTISVEFNQSLLDKWLVAVPEIKKLSKSAMAPKNDDEALQHMERICADAGFNSVDQCSEIIGYAGMMFGGFDP